MSNIFLESTDTLLALSVTKDLLVRLFRYDAWATGRLIEALEGHCQPGDRLLELLGHTLIAKRLWMARVRGEDATCYALWPQMALEDCRRLFAEVEEEFALFLESLTPDDFDHKAHYLNVQGRPYDNRIGDILLHLSHHAAYHRGQIATHMRAAGLEAPNTDYIMYARETSE